MGSLSTEQIDHYWELGFVVVPKVLGQDEIERYLTRVREIALGDVPEEAAKLFQLDNDLEPTGKLDDEALAKLEEAHYDKA